MIELNVQMDGETFLAAQREIFLMEHFGCVLSAEQLLIVAAQFIPIALSWVTFICH